VGEVSDEEARVIEELAISGLGVIEEATLELAPGLTVVTGETGAGKTMVVTALELLLGARADTSLIRAGASTAVASAVVRPVPAAAGSWVDADAEELVVSRELRAEGRSRARLAGTLAPVSALAEVLGPHVEVHAQHEHVRLSRPEVQRTLLDRSAGDPHARTLLRYREAHGRWSELQVRRDRLAADARERARELDRLARRSPRSTLPASTRTVTARSISSSTGSPTPRTSASARPRRLLRSASRGRASRSASPSPRCVVSRWTTPP
jgi:DNA repair protein RecN (Recombination protein N)